MPAAAEFDDLLPAAQAGAGWALSALWEAYSPSVRRYAASRGSLEPDDLTSEVFLGVLTGIASFEGDAAFGRGCSPWRTDGSSTSCASGPDAGPTPRRRSTSRAGASAEDRALENDGTARALALLAGLSPDQQEVLLLRIVADLSVEQVAAAVGKRPGAVKALQRRGLDSLRRVIPAQDVSSLVPSVDLDAMTEPR